MRRANAVPTSSFAVFLGAAVICLLGVPTASEAKIALASNVQSVGIPLAGDGNRYIAYLRQDSTPVVHDSFKSQTRKILGADGCVPAAIGGGHVLLECEPARSFNGADEPDFRSPRIASVKGGSSRILPNVSGNDRYESVGRYWAAGDNGCQEQACRFDLYQNLRTGAVRRIKSERTHGLILDLNRPILHARKRPPFGFNPADVAAFNRHVAIVESASRLYVKLAKREFRDIGSSLGAGSDNGRYFGLSLGRNRVTWVDSRNVVHAANIFNSGQFQKQLPRPSIRRYKGTVVPVRDGIYISTFLDKSTGPEYFGSKLRYRFQFRRLPSSH